MTKPKPRYTLAELLAQCDASAEISPEDREWLDAPPVGREILPPYDPVEDHAREGAERGRAAAARYRHLLAELNR